MSTTINTGFCKHCGLKLIAHSWERECLIRHRSGDNTVLKTYFEDSVSIGEIYDNIYDKLDDVRFYLLRKQKKVCQQP